jgi:fucose 4-O-acetylase-like acetyltransferase
MKLDASNATPEQRNIQLDILKVIGLFCVILAHTNAPPSVISARSFDVPLLIVISGALCAQTVGYGNIGFLDYVRKRVIRLLAPTWIFLTFFFLTVLLLVLLIRKPYPFSPSQVLSSYALLTGIGYVWIIRIFILVAIAAPLLLRMKKRLSEYGFLAILALAYLFYELLYGMIGPVENQAAALFVNQVLFYFIPYGVIFGVGLCLPKLSRRAIALLLGILALILGATMLHLHAAGLSLHIAEYKYPPRFYFVAYGLTVSLVLYLATSGIGIAGRHASALIVFISSSSLWVYLWHIFFVYYWNLAAYRLLPPGGNYLVSFAVLLLLPLAATYIQKQGISRIIAQTAFGRKHGQLMTPLFLK